MSETKIYGIKITNTSSQIKSLSTSNDKPVLGNDGNIIKYDYSTYKN